MMTKKIDIKGVVIPDDLADVYDWFNYSAISPSKVNDILNDDEDDDNDIEDVVININSPGGYVDAASEIYTALKGYKGHVTANIVGQACSSASWIALAADKVNIAPTGQFMIHRASTGAEGNSDDIASALQSLTSMDSAFVDLYANKTGLDKQTIYQMMSKETWLNAKEAVENGFADKIMFQEEQQPAVVNAEGTLPIDPSMVDKMKNLIHNKKSSQPVENDVKPEQPMTNIKNERESKRELVNSKLSLLFGKEN